MADFRRLVLDHLGLGTQTLTSVTSFSLNFSTTALEFIFQVPEAITITRLGYRLTAVTGTAPQYKISLQGVDANGDPDGTIKGGGSPASGLFTPAGSNIWSWKALDNSYAAARGEMLAVVIGHNSGTIDGSNFASFGSIWPSGANSSRPYTILNTAGSRSRQSRVPFLGYGTATQAYGFPAQSFNQTVFNSGSTPDEYALQFLLLADWVTSYTVVGLHWYGTSPTAASALLLRLYDDDGTTVLQEVSLDGDHFRGSGLTGVHVAYFDESSLTALSGGTAYRLGLQAVNTTASGAVSQIEVAAAADLTAYSGGEAWHSSVRTDAGAWTDETTIRPAINPIIADWSVPGGGGGLLTHPGMTGGARG